MRTFTLAWLLIAAVLLILPSAYAQDAKGSLSNEWIVPLENTRISARINKKAKPFKDKKHYKNLQFVELRSVADAQQNGVLVFHVPGDKNKHEALAQDIEAENKSNYVWTGELLDTPGSITITSEKGKMAARMDVDGKNYEIYPLEDNIYAVVERTPIEFLCPSVEVAEDIHIEPEEDEGTGSINGRETGCTAREVRVLVLSTARARRTGLNPRTVANQAIADFNTAQRISAVNGRITLVLAGIGNWNRNEGALAQNDIPILAGDANVRALRAANDADLVVCFTDGNYPDALGIVDAIGPSFNDGFALVEIQTALSPFVFVHEVGHLYGLQHEDCNAWNRLGCIRATAGTFDHGFNFTRPSSLFRRTRRYRTVMHNPLDNYSMLLNFSNPDVNYDTRATGRAGEYDNARELEIRDRTVANFDRTEDLTASITGPTSVNLYENNTWEAVFGCGDNYTFQWETSNDGFTYYQAGTGEFLNRSVYDNIDRIYIRLRVTSGDQTATAFRTVYVNGSNFRRGVAQSDSVTWGEVLEYPEENGIVLQDVYPNPALDQSKIEFYLPEQQTIRLDVIDLNGKLIRNIVGGDFEAGSYEFNVDHSILSTGIYLYQLKAGDVALTKRLVIQKE